MADDLASTLAEAKRRHYHGHTSNPRRDYCTADNQDWPCDVPRLLAAVEALTAALERHRHSFTGSAGVDLCGGCLEPSPCKYDPEAIITAALTRVQLSEDGDHGR